jgi:hypothetical protein
MIDLSSEIAELGRIVLAQLNKQIISRSTG